MSPLERMNAIRDLRAEGVRAFEKVVLFALASRVNAGGCAWPSVKRIAADAGMAETAARRVLRTLEALGFIRIQRRSGAPSYYWFVDEALAVPRDANPLPGDGPVAHDAMGRGSRPEPEGDQEGDHKGDHSRDRRTIGRAARARPRRSGAVSLCDHDLVAEIEQVMS